MYEMHTTNDGNSVLIASMDNDHLMNTIRSHCNSIKQARSVLCNVNIDPLVSALSGVSESDFKKKATETLRWHHDRLSYYVMEATLRSLPVSTMLQEAYGRKEALNNFFSATTLKLEA